MNNDQIKEKLLMLDDSVEDFTVVMSGKSSKRVDGLYRPESREIIIHNKNFDDDNAMMYTAIHEFAHHVHFTTSPVPVPVTSRSHTIAFWDILHRLLGKAEGQNMYINIFFSDPDFRELTGHIKSRFLSTNGRLMKEFGGLLMKARELCMEKNASFDDYTDRVLGLHRTSARAIMNVFEKDVDPEIGFENMKTVASMKDPAIRREAEVSFLEGSSPDMVKSRFSPRKDPGDDMDRLMSEKQRIEKTLDSLTVRLAKIERKIQDLRSVR